MAMKKIRKLICKIFGHMYATKPREYENFKEHYVDYCPMCGKIHEVRSYWVD